MNSCNTDNLVSILKESPVYMTLSIEEREDLTARLAESYPFLVEGRDEENEVGYESSWAEVL
jgi:hypothetical protein